MRSLYTYLLTGVLLFAGDAVSAQQTFRGKIMDAVTKEPLAGVSVHCPDAGCSCGCISTSTGNFEWKPMKDCCQSVRVSCIGYETQTIQTGQPGKDIYMKQAATSIQTLVVSANREGIKRSQAPIAISAISSAVIKDTKPVSADQLLNKVSGVYMVNLGNEQHSMSIRQPMSTKSLFLYLEDGIPIRTTGLFNHNALLEMNLAAVKQIEVIKGPSSSLYGSEAIGGVVNFITMAPPSVPIAKLELQGNNIGYKRADLQAGFSSGKWGFVAAGYYAAKNNGYIEYTDFHKAALTLRADYHVSERAVLTNQFTMVDYYSDMTGGIDSARFADRSFGSMYTFTYRKVNAFRYRSTFTYNWADKSKTTASAVYRNNTIGQNPAYAIKDDHRARADGTWAGKKELAHGEINEAGFSGASMIIQHRQDLDWKKARLITGTTTDISPSEYKAEYLRISRDSSSGVYRSYERRDSLLTNYSNSVSNYAVFAGIELEPVEKLRIVGSLRYDLFVYDFDNYLAPSAYSGSPDTTNHFKRVSPKIGFTYNFSARKGVYLNYSEGFVPPQVTEMYKGVKVPSLQPSVFRNYEAGGWAVLWDNKVSADFSIYQLNGSREIISVKMDDGSTQNMNAGKTSHKGIEVGVTATPLPSLSLRFSGAYSRHKFVTFKEKGITYDGNEMNGAPRWIHNAEAWYKPAFIGGLRIGLEWQRTGSYYMDPLNMVKYRGFNVLHLRLGYRRKAYELWAAVINMTDNYYAYTASRSSSGYNYTPAEPRNVNIGVSYDLSGLFKKDK